MTLARPSPFLQFLKWFAAAALSAGLVACGSSDRDEEALQFAPILTGEQEVPPVATGATGRGTLMVALPSRTVSGNITLEGMTANAAHIHEGAPGVNGPVIIPLAETSPGVWSVPAGTVLTEAQEAALRAGNLYFNAHSTANPGGEIRAQIGREVLTATLSQAQEVPPTGSTATGTGMMTVDPATRQFSARMTVTGMAATAAHIHEGAPNVNGPIVFPLAQSSPGVWTAEGTLTEAQLATMRAGNFYFNAHSTAFPNGEIRGQIGRLVGFARLTGAEEVPPTPSTATGSGNVVVHPETRVITGAIALTGLAPNMAHIHIGAPGTNGPVIVTLVEQPGNVWVVPGDTRLTPEQLRAFKQGNLYFNAHTPAFPGGEIRGQIR